MYFVINIAFEIDFSINKCAFKFAYKINNWIYLKFNNCKIIDILEVDQQNICIRFLCVYIGLHMYVYFFLCETIS